MLKRYALAVLSGALYFLGFAGFDLWPLAFVALVPMLFVLDPRVELKRRELIGLGMVFGFVANLGGYYWIANTLEDFSGFSYPVCILFASVVWVYQSSALLAFSALYRYARKAGFDALLAACAAMVLVEWAIPLLFEHYFGASLHNLPLAIQVADLGGPLLVSGLLTAANVGFYVLVRSALEKRLALREPAIAAALWLLTLGYGAYRIHGVDGRSVAAQKITVGTIQTNMGLFEKREDPEEGLRRHLEQSVELTKQEKLDLLVWPESAFAWILPEDMRNVRRAVLGNVIRVPTLFGGLSRRQFNGRPRPYNTAFLTDKAGNITGTYDKIYLLAFGEYLPFGETFPILYEWSPNSGNFAAGLHRRPLLLDDKIRISVLICYEDILPNFVRGIVKEANPELFVNLSNDAWFGNTHEPWEHLALAKFRSVEHHRSLVRATNSGVSAMIDPVGRVVKTSGVYVRENLSATLPLMNVNYLYQTLGDVPALLAVIAFAVAYWRRRRSLAAP
jgi:apolipoprotein N-acyltransferase